LTPTDAEFNTDSEYVIVFGKRLFEAIAAGNFKK
jgi:hypothetical protein